MPDKCTACPHAAEMDCNVLFSCALTESSLYRRLPHSVRTRVYLTVGCPSVCLPQLSTAAAACGGFAAVSPAGRRHRSIAAGACERSGAVSGVIETGVSGERTFRRSPLRSHALIAARPALSCSSSAAAARRSAAKASSVTFPAAVEG